MRFFVINISLSMLDPSTLGDKWYLCIKPEWFFSRDGLKKSYYHDQRVDWLKSRKRTKTFLTTLNSSPIFSNNRKT